MSKEWITNKVWSGSKSRRLHFHAFDEDLKALCNKRIRSHNSHHNLITAQQSSMLGYDLCEKCRVKLAEGNE